MISLKSITKLNFYHYLIKKKVSLVALVIVTTYTFLALLVYCNLLAGDWHVSHAGDEYLAPCFKYLFGTDFLGRSVLKKILIGLSVAMNVGFITAISASMLGVILGCIGGYFGGFIDNFVVWICNILNTMPRVMLIIAIATLFDRTQFSIYLALCMTNFVTLCRLIRAEVMRHKTREYVQAATVIGASHFRKIFIHILPNVIHIAIIQFSLIFQNAIKIEVIISFLGIGAADKPSWGNMINEGKSELLRGCWWQVTFATLAMFGIVLAFNLLSDALRDATDPKLRKR